MLSNYFKIAFRNLQKQRGYAAINILGLALGLTCCLLIALWVLDELSYDGYHKNADRICRVDASIKFGGSDMEVAAMPAPLAPTLVKDYPQIETACRLRNFGKIPVWHKGARLQEDAAILADSTLFRVFSLPLLSGNPTLALAQPRTVVISEKIARKYFGAENALGQSLSINNKEDVYQISGVMKDMPDNGHFKFDFLLSMSSLPESTEGTWLSNNFHTYVLFREGVEPGSFAPELGKIAERYVGADMKPVLNITWDEFKNSGNRYELSLMPLRDIHLYAGSKTDTLRPGGSIGLVWAFSAIALFILALAMVNFMNLSTARSSMRSREVGVRKALGSKKGQLVAQFLTESVLMSGMALLIAVASAALLLPLFNQLADKKMAFDFVQRPWLTTGLLGASFLTGLLAGLYPAFFLSSFRPAQVLKSDLLGSAGGKSFRNGLVTFQFATSIGLIIGALVVYRQLSYIQNKNIGYEREQILVVNGTQTLGEAAKVFKNQVLQLPQVSSGTISGNLPTTGGGNNGSWFKEKNFSPENAIMLNSWTIDADYLPTLGMKLVAGRNFRPETEPDSNTVILNQAAAKMLGFPDALDQALYGLKGMTATEDNLLTWKIVGIVQDFNYESLHNDVKPLVLLRGNSPDKVSFRLNTSDLQGSLAQIESIWKKTAPGVPFDYQFMDEQFDQMYRSERRTGLLALLAAGIAIFVACLGLFGLAAFTAERRRKEIGIRKVLGASVAGITGLLAKDFLKLVVLAIFIASPVAYFFMKNWLNDFAYRIEIEWWMFAGAGLAAVLIACLTVGFQSVRAALANPVKSLRSE